LQNMSQKSTDEISHDAGNGVQFTIHDDLSLRSAHSHDSEIKTVSLGIPDNEPLQDAEKGMDELARNSINHWED